MYFNTALNAYKVTVRFKRYKDEMCPKAAEVIAQNECAMPAMSARPPAQETIATAPFKLLKTGAADSRNNLQLPPAELNAVPKLSPEILCKKANSFPRGAPESIA